MFKALTYAWPRQDVANDPPDAASDAIRLSIWQSSARTVQAAKSPDMWRLRSIRRQTMFNKADPANNLKRFRATLKTRSGETENRGHP